jgi:RNA polymerase sigma factor (sigma-70 family)
MSSFNNTMISTGDNEQQFLARIEAHKGILYKIANVYARSAEDREDLVQETIIKLWQSHSKFNGQCQYSTWMYRVALNTAISFYRKERTRSQISGESTDLVLELPHMEYDPETDHRIAEMNRFITELPELDRALTLLYLDQRPYKEIAEILGLSEGNLSTRMNRIKNRLKEKFRHSNTL